MCENEIIQVAKPFLPDINDYIKYLTGIWDRNQLTNNGPLALELEDKLKSYLGVKHLFFVGNGTIALQIAIKALDLKGDIITTPFSYVATTSSIVWEGCNPVFSDIDNRSFNIDPDEVIKKINSQTSAILATHVYGNPCNVSLLNDIAKKYNLKIVYDAAHAFGTEYNDQSILKYGDISTLSFHATKLFHTIEGGAIITNDDELAHRISYMRSFGHNGPENFWGLGINGKNSEFHAAMGLCILPHVKNIIDERKYLSGLYDKLIKFEGSGIERPYKTEKSSFNYSYYPILLPNELTLNKVIKNLNSRNVYPRRYFYPSLNSLNYVYSQSMPMSENISKRALCLPLFNGLEKKAVEFISKSLNDCF
jgi:dTDP-4-amino-4,6-dideoxygalactose transaminase